MMTACGGPFGSLRPRDAAPLPVLAAASHAVGGTSGRSWERPCEIAGRYMSGRGSGGRQLMSN
jgi:hypothetical protein